MDERRDDQDVEELFTRPPSVEDLVSVCRHLNEEGARYAVIGGMAMNHYGLVRGTQDIDLLVDGSVDNMKLVIRALGRLPDGAAHEIRPEEIQQYSVIRINDEITIDLLAKACGVTFQDAGDSLEMDDSLGVPIPFVSPAILLRTKDTYRDVDRRDAAFLRELR